MSKLEDVSYMLGNLSGDNILGKFYGGHLEQWDLTGWENGKVVSRPFDRAKQKKLRDSKDNVWYDLTMQGNKEVNEMIKFVPDIYYFSWPCYATIPTPFDIKGAKTQSPMLTASPIMWPFAISIGKYKKNTVDDYPIDEKWLQNDGMVNTISERAPFSDPSMDLKDARGEYKKGIWYVYDPFKSDHLGICGGFLPPSHLPIHQIYHDHFRLINNLKK